jgi:hypothetical protein
MTDMDRPKSCSSLTVEHEEHKILKYDNTANNTKNKTLETIPETVQYLLGTSMWNPIPAFVLLHVKCP